MCILVSVCVLKKRKKYMIFFFFFGWLGPPLPWEPPAAAAYASMVRPPLTAITSLPSTELPLQSPHQHLISSLASPHSERFTASLPCQIILAVMGFSHCVPAPCFSVSRPCDVSLCPRCTSMDFLLFLPGLFGWASRTAELFVCSA